MQSIRIAFKNILGQMNRTLLLGGAIAFGFFVFTIVNGFTNGLLQTVEDNFSDTFGGHIYVSGTEVSDRGSEINIIRDTQAIYNALPAIEDQIFSYNTRSSANTSLIFGNFEENQSLIGIDFNQEVGFLDSLSFVEGSANDFLANESGILLPEDIFEDLGVEIDENVIIKTTTINGQQNIGDGIVVGSIVSEESFGISSGYIHIATLNKLLDMSPDQFQTFNLYLKDLSVIESVTDALHKELSSLAETEPRNSDEENGFQNNILRRIGFSQLNSVDESERWSGTKFSLSTLNDRTDNVKALISIMDIIGLAIFFVILGIIMVGVMNSYRMVMLERTAEIGTMRAMGIQKGGVRNIFISEAFFIALGGAIVGLVLAFLFMAGVSLYEFDSSNFTLFLNQGHLQFAITTFETVGNILVLCLTSIASVYLPARAAANLKPAEALRTSY